MLAYCVLSRSCPGYRSYLPMCPGPQGRPKAATPRHLPRTTDLEDCRVWKLLLWPAGLVIQAVPGGLQAWHLGEHPIESVGEDRGSEGPGERMGKNGVEEHVKGGTAEMTEKRWWS